jgi:chromosome segregation ATPase
VGIIAHGTPQDSLRAPSVATSSSAPNGNADGTAAPIYDFDRLERAIEALVGENARLRRERETWRGEVEGMRDRIRALEGQLRGANQRRQDVAKRIDELIAQMDSLDAQLAATEPEADASS